MRKKDVHRSGRTIGQVSLESTFGATSEILNGWAKSAVILFFVALAALGFAVHKDYGLSWDEPISHLNGKVSLAYVLTGEPILWQYVERYYGVLFELPFALLHNILDLPMQSVFFIRHLGTFLFFIFGVYAFYKLCERRFQSHIIALLGSVFLVLSPRIFADAFYNSKDIPTLVLFTLAMLTLSRVLERPTAGRFLLHAIASAAVIAVRLPGLIVPAITIAAVVLATATRKPPRRATHTAALLLLYLITTTVCTVVFWPYLWQHPITHFVEALQDMSRFSRFAEGLVLYRGQFLRAADLPWHYVPTWIAITTPPLYLALFAVGLCTTVWRFVRHLQRECRAHGMDLAIIAWCIGPIVSVIVLQSVIYDGWRHLYFVYPAFLYIALLGVQTIVDAIQRLASEERQYAHIATWVVLALHCVAVGSFMIRNHPYQNVYFNLLAGGMRNARINFDLDYWGLSFREGLEYIASVDDSPLIPVAFQQGSTDNVLMLRSDTQRRFRAVTGENAQQAKYVLSNYRLQRYADLPLAWEVYAVKVDGVSIMSVLRVP